MHPAWRRCSSVEYSRYSFSSRLARRAPRRPRCDAGTFTTGWQRVTFPHAYETPVAVLLFVSGVLTCFAGYHLFKSLLAIYGFVLGAAIAVATMGVTSPGPVVFFGALGGIAGALILVFAYFIGIALVGASLGALVAHVGWHYVNAGDPPLTLVVVLAVLGAMGAMLMQRVVIILATAFGGAWTTIVGALTITGDHRLTAALAEGNLSVFYPPGSVESARWVPIAWIVLGLLGAVIQLAMAGRRK